MDRRKASSIIKRTAALAMALVLGLGDISGSITVYADDVKNGSTGLADVSGGGASEFARDGMYIAVTPLYGNDTVTSGDVIDTLDTADSVTNSYRVEEYVGTEEALLSLPSQNAATLLFVPYSTWSNAYQLRTEGSARCVWARANNTVSGTNNDIKARTSSEYLNNIVWCEYTGSGKKLVSNGSYICGVNVPMALLSDKKYYVIFLYFLKNPH
jgi:hypothetical protein